MKLYELKAIANRLNQYKTIKSIYRVDDSIIEITFDINNKYYFDMTKGNSIVYKKDDYKKIKDYNAPFDVVLQKKFAKSDVVVISTDGDNRVLKIVVSSKSSYKEEISTLLLEFTGKNTNAIIIDTNKKIQEALRHIDSSVSFREIKPNKILLDIPPKEITENIQDIPDVDSYLQNIANQIDINLLSNTKKQAIYKIDAKISKLQKALTSLENEEELKNQSTIYAKKANAVLANLNNINLYETKMQLKDYEENIIDVEILPQAKSSVHLSNLLFDKSKKLRQKAENLYIQRDNLTQKIFFFDKLKGMINASCSIDECKVYIPTKKQTTKKRQVSENYEAFFYEGFKVMVGRTETENIYLLKNSSKDDYWFHLKDMPSSHIIVATNKKSLPFNVIEFASKLCVDFSVNHKGTYLVDYTKRVNVKVKNGANVLYVNYKTISIEKG